LFAALLAFDPANFCLVHPKEPATCG
jgi:hypothetical protein